MSARKGLAAIQPRDTWAGPRSKRRARLEDRLADAIAKEERAKRRMRRAFNAWAAADQTVARLSAECDKLAMRDAPAGLAEPEHGGECDGSVIDEGCRHESVRWTPDGHGAHCTRCGEVTA